MNSPFKSMTHNFIKRSADKIDVELIPKAKLRDLKLNKFTNNIT